MTKGIYQPTLAYGMCQKISFIFFSRIRGRAAHHYIKKEDKEVKNPKNKQKQTDPHAHTLSQTNTSGSLVTT